ncbi:MAG: PAS domain S-box protein [Bacteroidales bacterium]|nr:PAS domain S-box protein [Bacteroidales bacterium]
MKKKKLKRLTWIYALRGLIFGLVVSLVVLLMAANSDSFHQSERTLSDFIKSFPSFWVIIILPLLTAAAGFLLSLQFVNVIKTMKKLLKDQEARAKSILVFVEGLGAGSTNVEIGIEDKDDELVASLLKLQKSLKDNEKNANNRREEEKQRTWVTNGVAQFGEILRRNNNNIEELSYNIIRYLVDYMKINQAGFFLLHTGKDKGDAGQRFYELTAFVAYDRKKYANKRIEWGEGLVGRCGQEQQTIYMTDIPKDYITVTSGLGDANPGALLLVPLKINDEVYGVIEMASLLPLLEYEISFVEKTAESIAQTISTVKSNMQTQELLQETQKQAKKNREQEERLMQNIEEMRATEEENKRNALEMQGFIDAINEGSISCQFEIDGTIKTVNENFLRTFGYKEEEIMEQNMSIFFFKEDVEQLDDLLSKLTGGETFSGRVRRRSKKGEEIWLLSTYTPVKDIHGEVIKVISLETNIADQVKLEREMQDSQKELDYKLQETRKEIEAKFKEIEAVKVRNEKTLDGMLDAIITTNNDGKLEFFNVAAEALWGYDRSEVLGQDVSMLFTPETIQTNDFVKAFVTPDMPKVVGERKEIPIKDKFGEEKTVLLLLSEAEVNGEHSFTAFIQNIEVELF